MNKGTEHFQLPMSKEEKAWCDVIAIALGEALFGSKVTGASLRKISDGLTLSFKKGKYCGLKQMRPVVIKPRFSLFQWLKESVTSRKSQPVWLIETIKPRGDNMNWNEKKDFDKARVSPEAKAKFLRSVLEENKNLGQAADEAEISLEAACGLLDEHLGKHKSEEQAS